MKKTNWLKCTDGPVLLTEGDNDCHVIAALCGAHNVKHTFGFYSCGSDDQAIRRLELLLRSSNCPTSIGIVLDADAPSLASKWHRLTALLTDKGYALPAQPSVEGTVLTVDDLPKLGIWLMPDNKTDGMLEDFCLTLAPAGALEHTQQYLNEAKAQGYAKYKDVHNAKALIHTFLGTQDEPGSPIGQAITRKVLSPTEPSATVFTNWLKSTFDA